MVRVCVLFVVVCVSGLNVFVGSVCDLLCGVVWYVVCVLCACMHGLCVCFDVSV